MSEPPSAAQAVFGDALDAARCYADLLAGPGVERGLLGPREVPRLWDRHLLNCAVVAELLSDAESVLDIGSGAGLPGIPLALAQPDLRVVLVDSKRRRCAFLCEAVDLLGITDRVTVRCARVEDLRGVVTTDVVTTRAVTSLARLSTWAGPLLAPGGTLLALKGSTVEEEFDDASGPLVRAGFGPLELRACGMGVVDPPTIVVRAVRVPVRDETQARG